MPLLAGFLGSLFSTFVTWLGAFLTKRAANYVALAIGVAAACAACWAVVYGMLQGIVVAAPDAVVWGASLFLPSNTDEVLSVYLGVEVSLAGYRWHKETMRASVAAT